MSETIFPWVFANDDFRLLSGLFLGFLFGFALERGGFGNARKLAAQFYGHDMAVFKVMFSAILVAMVGLFVFVQLGWMNLDGLFINPTFMGTQVAGGLLMGTGFLISGLCPGTAIVSAASGRWDGVVAFLRNCADHRPEGEGELAERTAALLALVPGLVAAHEQRARLRVARHRDQRRDRVAREIAVRVEGCPSPLLGRAHRIA